MVRETTRGQDRHRLREQRKVPGFFIVRQCSINHCIVATKILTGFHYKRHCRDYRRDRIFFSISAMLIAAVAPVATIVEECVSIYRYRR